MGLPTSQSDLVSVGRDAHLLKTHLDNLAGEIFAGLTDKPDVGAAVDVPSGNVCWCWDHASSVPVLAVASRAVK
jgi:hypothetical protein